MKKILITAGPVHVYLDDNKLITNKSRGIWAIKLAHFLRDEDFDLWEKEIHLLLPKFLQSKELTKLLNCYPNTEIHYHDGYYDYAEKCYEFAKTFDAMIMASAVTNYIPEYPYKGKMPTTEDRILIPFIKAPRVIEQIKKINPKITLIGCKLLSGSDYETLIENAYNVVLNSKCNAVIANDLSDLKKKYLVFQDKSVLSFEDDFKGLYSQIWEILNDVHFRTEIKSNRKPQENEFFDKIVDKYRNRFTKRINGKDFVFGSLMMKVSDINLGDGYLVSPREKGQSFSSKDAIFLEKIDFYKKIIYTYGGKATLNAPLLLNMIKRTGFLTKGKVFAILHLHEQLSDKDVLTMDYAPPGTVRDTFRLDDEYARGVKDIYKINIKHHGFVACLDENGDIISII
jgi:hypothetical protein